MRDVEVRPGGIALGQLLKFAGLVDTGGEAKALLAAGAVSVNGEPEGRRGRTLADGDVIGVAGHEPVRVAIGA
ncbi:MAG: RNA-binding S4 domain-containing protein [Gaiellales bacterium]